MSVSESSVTVLKQLFTELVQDGKLPGTSLCIFAGGNVILNSKVAKNRTSNEIPQSSPIPFTEAILNALNTIAIDYILLNLKEDILEQPIVKFVRDFKLPDDSVAQRLTLNDLFAHRTGFSGEIIDDIVWNSIKCSPHQWYQVLSWVTPRFEFRSKSDPSLTNTLLISYVMKRVMKESISSIMQKTVIEPLGLKDTRIRLFESNLKPCLETTVADISLISSYLTRNFTPARFSANLRLSLSRERAKAEERLEGLSESIIGWRAYTEDEANIISFSGISESMVVVPKLGNSHIF